MGIILLSKLLGDYNDPIDVNNKRNIILLSKLLGDYNPLTVELLLG